MKKFFSLMIVLAAVAMVSCGGNKKANAEAEATATEVVAEETTCCEKSDSCTCDECDGCCEKCDSCTCDKCAEAAAEAPAEEAK